MRNQLVLNIGVFAVAVALGYMVGGSGTPVVGPVAPTIFGLVAAALSLVASGRMPSIGAVSAGGNDKADVNAPARVGVVLTIFAVAFISGSIVGTFARTQQWFAPEVSTPDSFPWDRHKFQPPTIESALQWIGLQKQLLKRGYSEAEIDTLYSIQVTEWERRKNNQDRNDGPEAGSLSDGDYRWWEGPDSGSGFGQDGGSNPFAQEVPEILEEYEFNAPPSAPVPPGQ